MYMFSCIYVLKHITNYEDGSHLELTINLRSAFLEGGLQ